MLYLCGWFKDILRYLLSWELYKLQVGSTYYYNLNTILLQDKTTMPETFIYFTCILVQELLKWVEWLKLAALQWDAAIRNILFSKRFVSVRFTM